MKTDKIDGRAYSEDALRARGENNFGVPPHILGGLIGYLFHGEPGGSFIQAVLRNDLIGAVRHADPEAAAALAVIVRFLMSEAPLAAWGSESRVANWTALARGEY